MPKHIITEHVGASKRVAYASPLCLVGGGDRGDGGDQGVTESVSVMADLESL